jgi:hypothetical protein
MAAVECRMQVIGGHTRDLKAASTMVSTCMSGGRLQETGAGNEDDEVRKYLIITGLQQEEVLCCGKTRAAEQGCSVEPAQHFV